MFFIVTLINGMGSLVLLLVGIVGHKATKNYTSLDCSLYILLIFLFKVFISFSWAAHVQHVIMIQRVAVELGLDSEAVAADALAVQLVALLRALAKPAYLQAATATVQGAHAAVTYLLGVILVLRRALLDGAA